MLTDEMPLRTTIIREAHDQPLSSYLGQTKLRHLLQQRYAAQANKHRRAVDFGVGDKV